MKLGALAETLGVDPSTTTRMVDRLIARGLVGRRLNPTSRREVLLDLTAAGSRTVVDVTRRRRKRIASIVSRMPERHGAALVEVLRAFNEAGGEPPATGAANDDDT